MKVSFVLYRCTSAATNAVIPMTTNPTAIIKLVGVLLEALKPIIEVIGTLIEALAPVIELLIKIVIQALKPTKILLSFRFHH